MRVISQLSYTTQATQRGTVLVIFPVNLQTISIAKMMPIGREEDVIWCVLK